MGSGTALWEFFGFLRELVLKAQHLDSTLILIFWTENSILMNVSALYISISLVYDLKILLSSDEFYVLKTFLLGKGCLFR